MLVDPARLSVNFISIYVSFTTVHMLMAQQQESQFRVFRHVLYFDLGNLTKCLRARLFFNCSVFGHSRVQRCKPSASVTLIFDSFVVYMLINAQRQASSRKLVTHIGVMQMSTYRSEIFCKYHSTIKPKQIVTNTALPCNREN